MMKRNLHLEELTDEHLRPLLAYHEVPERFWGGIIRYLEARLDPGHFLGAILEQNLGEVISRADKDAWEAVRPIYRFLYNDVPSVCWGTKEKVEVWTAGQAPRGGQG